MSGQYIVWITAPKRRWYPAWLPGGTSRFAMHPPDGSSWDYVYDWAMKLSEMGAKVQIERPSA